jgi:hypothetical protein
MADDITTIKAVIPLEERVSDLGCIAVGRIAEKQFRLFRTKGVDVNDSLAEILRVESRALPWRIVLVVIGEGQTIKNAGYKAEEFSPYAAVGGGNADDSI